MRLGTCILAEGLVAVTALAGGGLVTQEIVLRLGQGFAALSEGRRVEGLPSLPPRGEISDPPPLAIASEPRGTFLGMSDDLLLERVRSQRIVRVKLNSGGTSLSFRVDFADGSRAAFKPAQTNLQTIPRKEVAAYRLNRLLGLNAVPPAAPRTISRDDLLARLHPESLPALPRIRAETIFDLTGKTAGVAMYWIPEVRDSGLDTRLGLAQSRQWLSLGIPLPPGRRSMAAQVSNLIVFDFLTSNPDRYSGGNMKMSRDGERLYFMDNTLAFFLDTNGNAHTRPALMRTQRFSRGLYQALERITMPELERIFSEDRASPYEILTSSEIRAVVARRDAVRRHIDLLAAAHGEKAVLAFP
jgi:hypothetical protein